MDGWVVAHKRYMYFEEPLVYGFGVPSSSGRGVSYDRNPMGVPSACSVQILKWGNTVLDLRAQVLYNSGFRHAYWPIPEGCY